MQRDLPIWDLQASFSAAVRQGPAVVLTAPTGSGKTTQVPQMLLQEGAQTGRIVVLQPRRIAARAAAVRVAREMAVPVGQEVGYQVRFDDKTSVATRIAFVTDGILLRWLLSDPALAGVSTVIFDEFHERSLLADLALGLCRRLQHTGRRPDLRIVVMSATLDAAPVAAYLGGAPVLASLGRLHPVEISYDGWDDPDPVWERAARHVAALVSSTDDGDVLVFMPGAFEIERTMEEMRRLGLRSRDGRAVQVLALHGELPPAVQDRVFDPPVGMRRVVVSTNVAETSLTLPNILHVVDGGLARVARYDPARGVNSLTLEPISRASADQRAGRAGRVAPGTCHRLWSEREHAARPDRTAPEILREDLSEAALLLHALDAGGPSDFPWLDRPDPENARHADDLLELLGALQPGPDGARRILSSVGRRMLDIPAHPRHARVLIEAASRGCLADACTFVALASGRDLFLRLDRNDRITAANRKRFNTDPRSDLVQQRNAFEFARACQFDGRECRSHGIHPHAAREAELARRQLMDACAGLPVPRAGVEEDGLRRSHLTGNLDRLGARLSSGSDVFDMADGRQAELRDDSALRSRRDSGRLIVASELREIGQRDGGTLTLIGMASTVELDWVRACAPPDLSETMEHAYDRLNRRVVAARVVRFRQLLLGGTPVTPDPAESGRVLAREFMHVLLEGGDRPPFAKVTREVRALVADARKSGALADEALERALAAAWHGAISVKEAAGREVLPSIRAALQA